MVNAFCSGYVYAQTLVKCILITVNKFLCTTIQFVYKRPRADRTGVVVSHGIFGEQRVILLH